MIDSLTGSYQKITFPTMRNFCYDILLILYLAAPWKKSNPVFLNILCLKNTL